MRLGGFEFRKKGPWGHQLQNWTTKTWLWANDCWLAPFAPPHQTCWCHTDNTKSFSSWDAGGRMTWLVWTYYQPGSRVSAQTKELTLRPAWRILPRISNASATTSFQRRMRVLVLPTFHELWQTHFNSRHSPIRESGGINGTRFFREHNFGPIPNPIPPVRISENLYLGVKTKV